MTATLAGAEPVPDDAAERARLSDAPWRERLRSPVGNHGGWPATAGIALLAGLLRFLRLDIPRGKIFD